MAYSQADFERMKYDPELARCYLWRVATLARLRAMRIDNKHEAAFATAILDNLDEIVKTGLLSD
jgi:hypothetical protein